MSLKDNYIKITKKIFGGPSTNVMRNKIGESTIRSIMRGSDIGASEACKVAKELGVTVEELVTGRTIMKNASKSMLSDACRVYENKEELHLVDKLIEILRSKNEKPKKIITNNINILCGDKMWIKEGRQERRKKLVTYHGKLERRIKIHVYSS